MPLPSFAERLREIVSLNSISSEEPELDQSNESVIRCLERWFRELGFDVSIIKVKEKPLKYDLLARLGEGEEDFCSPGTLTRCRQIPHRGGLIPSPLRRMRTGTPASAQST